METPPAVTMQGIRKAFPGANDESQRPPAPSQATFGWIDEASGSTGAADPNVSPPAALAPPPSTHGTATSTAARRSARIARANLADGRISSA